MPDLATVRAVEEASLNAWPAHQTLVMKGWLLRFARGYTRRANSVNPIYAAETIDDPAEVAGWIERCEQMYRSHKQPTIFKMTPLNRPANLDEWLAARGYRREAPTGVRIRPLATLTDLPARDSTLSVDLQDHPSAAWMQRFADFNRVPENHLAAMAGILQAILPQRAFVTLHAGDTPVACGLGVREDGYLGLFDIVTAPSARGRGYGTQLLLHLLHWGASAGAETAYLQVMNSNQSARRLYDKLGFVEIYGYWYRTKEFSSSHRSPP